MLLSSSHLGPVFPVSVLQDQKEVRGSPDLELSSAYARPDERIWAQIALDVGRNDLSGDAVSRHKPLICPRHGDYESV